MWPFKSNYTGVKIVYLNQEGSCEIRKVYDLGEGCFIKSYLMGYPVYLKENGEFINPSRDCVGEAVSWLRHSGDFSSLKYYRV